MKKAFLISSLLFWMDVNTLEASCYEIENASKEPTVVDQSFDDYKKERGHEPLKLLFPGGRDLQDKDDLRGDQQKHSGFYTIDTDWSGKYNPHLKGSIFNDDLWRQIEDGAIDLTHIEVPGALFLYGAGDEQGRLKKDDYILRQVNKKLKIGGKLFVDLRYIRFAPDPNFDKNLCVSDARRKIEEMQKKDPDFFVELSLNYNFRDRAKYISKLLGSSNKDEIYRLLTSNYIGDREKLEALTREKEREEERLSQEELYLHQMPYLILFDKAVREKIFQEYDHLFSKYGFRRRNPIVEFYGKLNNGAPLPSSFQEVEGRVIYEGMCFLDTMAEYEKAQNLKETYN